MIAIAAVILSIGIFELWILMAADKSTKDAEQEEYIKQLNKKNRGDADGY